MLRPSLTARNVLNTTGLIAQKRLERSKWQGVTDIAESVDPEIRRYRFLRKTDQKQNGKYDSTEAEYQKAQYYKTTYEVAGWRQQGETGELWKANTLVTIRDDLLNNSQEMLITKVT